MGRQRFPAVFVRGGTSKALLFHARDLPGSRELWSPILLRAMGSPDPYGRQLDGMGGGLSSLSKTCVVAPSARSDTDVEYTFAQIMIDAPRVDYQGNCGNILAAVGPFAVEEGLVATDGSVACVRILNLNTGKRIIARFALDAEGLPLDHGELVIPGVAGSGAPIQLEFLEPGGATTGRLLPTGHVRESLDVAGMGKFEVSLIDAGNACVFIEAGAVGLRGDEGPFELERDEGLMSRLELIRQSAAVAMGLAADRAAAAASKAIPYLGIVSRPSGFLTLSHAYVPAGSHDFAARVIASGQPHRALPLTVSLCLAVAARIEGSVVHGVAVGDRCSLGSVRIGMPSGVLTLDASVSRVGDQWVAHSGSFFRTARRLFSGFVHA